MSLVTAQLYVALEGVHQSDEMVDDAGHKLLRVGGLDDGSVVGLLVETHNLVAEADVIDGFLRREETGAYAVVHIAALETNPIALPSCSGIGVVGMPLTREEQPEVAFSQVRLAYGCAVENAFALGQVEQLILVEFAAPFQFEVVAVGMAVGRVGVAGSNLLVPHGAYGKSPEGVTLIG